MEFKMMRMEKEPLPEYSPFLKRVYFLEKLHASEIDSIARLCIQEKFAKGSVIFVEGAAADKFYIVMDGEVDVWKDYGDHRRSLLASHGPGHFFGEMALVDELPRSATLLARTDTLALSIERDAFHTLIRNEIHFLDVEDFKRGFCKGSY
jgi:CRP-like cAMP-binding protein